jgi:cell division transport system permease protein
MFKFVKKNIRRTPYQSLAALMVMFLTFIAVSTFIIVALGSQRILVYYESKPQAIAFFKDNTTARDVAAIQSSLEQTGRVTSAKFISKEQALEIYRDRNKNNPTLLELVTANILPSSLEISAQTPEDLRPIAEIIKKEPVVEEVVFPEDVVSSLTQATRMIRIIGGSVVGFLIVFSTLIIIMIIGFKIRIKREEISIMRLLGASSWFIKAPFLLEGIFYAAMGCLMAWLLSYGALWYFQPMLTQNLGEVASVLFPISPINMLILLGAQLGVAILVGGLGSYVAVRRYLQI